MCVNPSADEGSVSSHSPNFGTEAPRSGCNIIIIIIYANNSQKSKHIFQQLTLTYACKLTYKILHGILMGETFSCKLWSICEYPGGQLMVHLRTERSFRCEEQASC